MPTHPQDDVHTTGKQALMDADEWDDAYLSMEDGLWLATLAGQREAYLAARQAYLTALAANNLALAMAQYEGMVRCFRAS